MSDETEYDTVTLTLSAEQVQKLVEYAVNDILRKDLLPILKEEDDE